MWRILSLLLILNILTSKSVLAGLIPQEHEDTTILAECPPQSSFLDEDTGTNSIEIFQRATDACQVNSPLQQPAPEPQDRSTTPDPPNNPCGDPEYSNHVFCGCEIVVPPVPRITIVFHAIVLNCMAGESPTGQTPSDISLTSAFRDTRLYPSARALAGSSRTPSHR